MGFRAAAIFLLSWALPTALARAADPPPPAECRWTETPIRLDGLADEPAWSKAQVIDNFQMAWIKEGNRTPKTWTKARLLWDREYLYFFAEMQDQDLFADVTTHNGRIWDNDVFEMFFKPGDDKPGYF